MDLQLAGDAGGVHRARATERDHGAAAMIDAALRRVDAEGADHVFIDGFMHAPAGPGGGERQRRRERRPDRPVGGPGVERHRPTEKEAGIEIAERQVGVGQGGGRAVAAVAGRSRIGAGAFRPHPDQAPLVDPADAAAAGADLDHVDDRDLQGQAAAILEAVDAGDLEAVLAHRPVVDDEGALGRGAALVEGQQVQPVQPLAEDGAHEGACRRAGFDEADGKAPRRRGRGGSAARGHQPKRAGEAQGAEAVLQAREVSCSRTKIFGNRDKNVYE